MQEAISNASQAPCVRHRKMSCEICVVATPRSVCDPSGIIRGIAEGRCQLVCERRLRGFGLEMKPLQVKCGWFLCMEGLATLFFGACRDFEYEKGIRWMPWH